MKHALVLIAAAMFLISCSAPLRFPEEAYTTRASPDISQLTGRSMKTSFEESSPEIRAVVLEAIRKDQLGVGSQPKRAIDASELISLIPVAPNSATGDSRVNYRAIVRLNFDRHTLDQEYLVFEKAGQVTVRKISL